MVLHAIVLVLRYSLLCRVSLEVVELGGGRTFSGPWY